jgi:hypothetical protein
VHQVQPVRYPLAHRPIVKNTDDGGTTGARLFN